MTATALELPVLADVLAARERIRKYLPQTELSSYTSLSELVGTEVWVKRENDLPTGAFKVRGGVNLVSPLTEHELRAGLIAASTGNHGQSVAYAAKLFGTQAIICVPAGANPVKVASMRSLGADVIFHGRDFDDAREHAEQLAGEHSYRYVHSGDEPHLIAGVATATIEIIEEQPQIDTIIVADGGGSGAAGACIAGKAIRPDLNVIGVQSEAAPAAYRSWKEGRLLDDRMETFAEGIATRVGFELPQPSERRCDSLGNRADDRRDASPRRAGRRRAAGRCAELALATRGSHRRSYLQWRQHHAPAAPRIAGAAPKRTLMRELLTRLTDES